VNTLELSFYLSPENQHSFTVSVEGSGEANNQPELPFLDRQIPDVVDRRFTIVKVLESTKFDKKNFDDETELAWMLQVGILHPEGNDFQPGYLATIGGKLYQVLGKNIQQVIETAIVEAKRDRTWLHIRLKFPAADPVRLTDYPWELLHNDYEFLVHSGVTFSRYIAYSSPPPSLGTVKQLNVLLISSRATDDNMGLKTLPDIEPKAIAQGLQQAQNQGLTQLENLAPPTWDVLRNRLLDRVNKVVPHVIHFDGHGFFGKRCHQPECRRASKQSATHCQCGVPLGAAQGYLIFERSPGNADYISARELGELLGNLQRREQPNSQDGIVLVVLSACRSGMSRLSETVFNGVAQKLIGQGIPSVVAMPYTVTVEAASVFSEYFYQSLGRREPLAIALRQGQSAIGIEGNQWYRPVLYLRWADNQGGNLFKAFPVQPVDLSHPMPQENSQRRKLRLQQDIKDLRDEQDVCHNQYRGTIDDAQKLTLKRKIDNLDNQINNLENELKNI